MQKQKSLKKENYKSFQIEKQSLKQQNLIVQNQLQKYIEEDISCSSQQDLDANSDKSNNNNPRTTEIFDINQTY